MGRLMKEKATKVRFKDEGKCSEEEKKEEQVAVMIHNEGQEGEKRCREEEGVEKIQEMESPMEVRRTESSISVDGESVGSMGADGEGDEVDEEDEEEELGRERRYETDSSVTVDGESVFTEV